MIEFAEFLKTSKRSELNIELLGKDFTWFDAGTHESLSDASTFVKTIETHQRKKIACLEEIDSLNGWITRENVMTAARNFKGKQYGH